MDQSQCESVQNANQPNFSENNENNVVGVRINEDDIDDVNYSDVQNFADDSSATETEMDNHSSKTDWLEQSWRGLANFNHSHIGRICAGRGREETLTEL